jgi:hypothetical protein
MDLDIIVYGDITLRQCLYVLGAIVATSLVLRIFGKLFFSKSEPMAHSIEFVCSSCGWRGRIGKYAARCPKCSQPVK